ncbi:unnamed protein product [Onchocerca ochengi]|uniref:Uncharacterized protein n=1 Tax=Onchocerca ochengi TaxID=42157 RepID=A0A182EUF0_ONCOC|nr:unnamed protein product [Onchocerca ochengi]
MAMRVERRAARLEKARLRACKSSSATSDLLPFEQNERDRLRVTERPLMMIEDLCLQIANKVLSQLRIPSPNQSATDSFVVKLRREQNYQHG